MELYAGTGVQPVPERFCLEIKAIKCYERGYKPSPVPFAFY